MGHYGMMRYPSVLQDVILQRMPGCQHLTSRCIHSIAESCKSLPLYLQLILGPCALCAPRMRRRSPRGQEAWQIALDFFRYPSHNQRIVQEAHHHNEVKCVGPSLGFFSGLWLAAMGLTAFSNLQGDKARLFLRT